MAVLQALAERPGEVVSAEFLVERVWGGRPMGDNPVYKCIAQLRKTFGDRASQPSYIATVPKRGYRLLAPVEIEQTHQAATTPEPAPVTGQPGPGDEFGVSTGAHLVATFAIVCLALVLAAVGVGRDSAKPDRGQPPGPESLAVLPFSVPEDARIPADVEAGLALEIADHLKRSDGLTVAPFDGNLAPGQPGPDNARVASRLGVEYLLTGRIRAESDSMAVRAVLLDQAGRAVWQGEYTEPAGDGAAFARRISQDVAAEFETALEPGINSRCRGTDDVQACQHYLMAREHIHTRSATFKSRAIELLHKAIAEDPSYAEAHATLARVYLLPDRHSDWDETRRQAGTAVERALELDENLPKVLAVKGLETMTSEHGPCPPACFDPAGYARAETLLRQAIEIEPDNPTAHLWLAFALSGQGQVENALSRLELAKAGDPMDPMIQSIYATFLAHQGAIDQARASIRSFQENHPDAPEFMYRLLARIESTFGHYDTSLYYALKAQLDQPGNGTDMELITAYRDLGLFDQVDLMLSSTPGDEPDEPFLLMHHDIRTARGETDKLAALLERMSDAARARHGATATWPRWKLRALGRSHSVLGNHDTAIAKLALAYPDDGKNIDYNELILELDGLHWFAYSLGEAGKASAASAVVDHSLEHIAHMDAQGFGQFPALVLARARAHGLQDDKALAVTHLRQAIARGWRGYWQIHGDPRWDELRLQPDVEELLGQVRREVHAMQLRIVPGLAMAGQPCQHLLAECDPFSFRSPGPVRPPDG